MKISLNELLTALKPYIWNNDANNSMGGNIVPRFDAKYNIGTPTNRIGKIYSSEIVGTTTFEIDASVAGAGLTYSAGVISVGQGDGISVSADAVAVASSIAGAGLTWTAGVMAVGAGTMISVSADAVGIPAGATYQFIGTGSGTLAAWQNLSTIAGNGLTMSSGVLNVAVSNSGAIGLSVSADQILLTTSSDPGATSKVLESTSAGYLYLTELFTPIISTKAATALYLSPTTYLWLNPTGDSVYMGSNVSIGRQDWVSQLTGWQITYGGAGDFRYLYSDELVVKSFIADLEQALAGGQIITKSVTTLAQDFVLPTAGNTGTLYVNDLPSAEGMAVFQSGDFVALRQFSRAGGGLTVAWAWGTVTSYVDDANKVQHWTFTRHATTPGAASGTIYADSIVLDFGVSGNGYYEVNAIDGLNAENSPYAQIVTWTTHPSNLTLRGRFGNLYGVSGAGVPDEYGMFLGSGVADSASYLRFSNEVVRLNNVPFQSWTGGNQTVDIDASGDVKFGTNVGAASTTTFTFDSATGSMRIGPTANNKPAITWDGTTLDIVRYNSTLVADEAVISLDSSGNSYFEGKMKINAPSGSIVTGDDGTPSEGPIVVFNHKGLAIVGFTESTIGDVLHTNALSFYKAGLAELGTSPVARVFGGYDFTSAGSQDGNADSIIRMQVGTEYISSSDEPVIELGYDSAHTERYASIRGVSNIYLFTNATIKQSPENYSSIWMASDYIFMNATVQSDDIRPSVPNGGSLGQNTNKWNAGYFSTIYADNIVAPTFDGENTVGILMHTPQSPAYAHTVVFNGAPLTNTSGWVTVPADQVTVDAPGWYNISYSVTFANTPEREVGININGSGQYAATKTTDKRASGGMSFYLSAGNTVSVVIGAGSSGEFGSTPVETLYVSAYLSITRSGTLGGTPSSGTWTAAGNMTINANGASVRTVYILNSFASGVAHLNVSGNLLLGGTVNGVDVTALHSNFADHLLTTEPGGAATDPHPQYMLRGDYGSELQSLVDAAVAAAGNDEANHSLLQNLAADDHVNYVHITNARTITARHTFNTSGAPFTIGALSTGVLVAGLNADTIDGLHASEIISDPGDVLTALLTVDGPGSGLNADLLDGYEATAFILATTTITAGSGLTGGGQVGTGVTIDVGAGNLITVDASSVSVSDGANYQFVGTGSGVTPGWRNVSELAGAGLTSTAGVLDVIAGNGISVAADSVAVDLGYAFAWTAKHTFSDVVSIGATGIFGNRFEVVDAAGSQARFAASTYDYLNFHVVSNLATVKMFSGKLALEADSDIDITPNGSLDLNATARTQSLFPQVTDTYDIGGPTLLYSSSFISTMNAVIFAENTATLLGGWFFVSHDAGAIDVDVAATDATIDFGKAMTPGDFVLIRAHAMDDVIKAEYIQVGTLVIDTEYNVTRDLAGAHVDDPEWAAGTPFVVLGTTGDGRIELNAYDTPRISMITQGATYNAQTEYIRIGDLNGMPTISSEKYGIFIGDATQYLRYVDGVLTIAGNGAGLTAIDGGNITTSTITGDKISLSSYLAIGSSTWGADGIQLQYNSGNPRFYAGNGSTNYLQFDGSNVYVSGSVTATSGTIGGWTLAATTLSGTNAVLSNTGYLRLGAASADRFWASAADASYRLWIGHDTPASAPFKVTKAGALVATGAAISGAITATSGSVTGTLAISGSGKIVIGSDLALQPTYGLTLLDGSAAINRVSWVNNVASPSITHAEIGPNITLHGKGLFLYHRGDGVSYTAGEIALWATDSTEANNAQAYLWSSATYAYLDVYVDDIRMDGVYKFWHAGNDGAGSGLDADTVDGSFGKNGSGYWTVDSWLQMAGGYGLYNPSSGSGTHWYPNDAGGGAWRSIGSFSGYDGIRFSSGLGNISLMFRTTTAELFGFYSNDSGAWRYVYDHATTTHGFTGMLTTSGKVAFAGAAFGTYEVTTTGSFYTGSGWYRAGSTYGLYFESYGGGWHMTDTSWVRVYNHKGIYTPSEIRGGRISTDVGGVLGEDWTAASLIYGWSNYGGGWSGLRYKRVGDVVFLEGMVKPTSTTQGSGSTIIYLPSGFRPTSGAVMIGAETYTGSTTIGVGVAIYTSGQVANRQTCTTSGWIYISGSFSIK